MRMKNAQIQIRPRVLSMLTIGMLAAFSASMESCESRSRAEIPASADACPYSTVEEWNVFLRASATQPDWGPTCEDSTCDADTYDRVRTGIQSVLESCRPYFIAHPKVAACTDRLRRFVPAWMRQHDGDSYGFRRNNHEYLKAQDAAEEPEGMMVPPEVLIAAIPSRTRVIEAARRNGYRYLDHDSGIDETRTFVLVPDPRGRFDQWFLLNLQRGKSTIQTHQPLSILVVQKKDAAGNVLPKVRLHFRDYTIAASGHGYRLALDETKNGKCYSCHTNGVRQLIPRITPVLEARPVRGEPGYDESGTGPVPENFALHRLQEFNRRLRSYGNPDWMGDIRPEDFGPPLGKAQGCIDCHDGTSRAALNIATSLRQLEKKVYYQLSMPPDNHLQRMLERNEMKNPELSEAEAAQLEQALKSQANLIRELEASRVATLRSWLLEVACQ